MHRLNGQLAVALTAALGVTFLLSLLALLARVLWQPNDSASIPPASVSLVIVFSVACLSAIALLTCYLARRDHARNGKVRKERRDPRSRA
jgi:ABC-type transport system involved in multi-copper enzyme maturation permease subunit